MELHQLRYFVAAAEAGSVSRAAERSRVAQPSLSQQIRKLEAGLGVRLFDRLGRGVALTDAGRALLPRARRILSEVRDAEANLKREASAGVGTLVVGAIPTIAPYVLPRALQQLSTEHGAADVLIHEGFTEDLVELLADNRLDCALVSTPLEHEHLEVQVVGHEELVLVMPRTHALAGRERVTWAMLREQATVTLREMHCLGRQIEGFCAARATAPRVVCEATQLSTIFELVARGLGVSIVPAMAAAKQGDEHWAYARLAPHTPVRQIAVAWRKDRTRARQAERLAGLIGEGMRA